MADDNDDTEKLTGGDLSTLPVSKKMRTEDQVDRENTRLKAKQYETEQEVRRLQAQLAEALKEKESGLKVFGADGVMEKRKRLNTSGISDRMLPPYMKNHVAIYKICGTDEINPATNLPVLPVDTSIPGRYTLHDRYEKDPLKRDKVMQNITGTEPYTEDGERKIRELIEDIIFVRGWLQVPIQDKYPLYIFLELHPMNKTNKFRVSNAVMAFERVDINMHSAEAQAVSLDLSLDAGNAVRAMKKDDVLAYAMTTLPPTPTVGRQLADIKTDLIRYAMNNPVPFFKQNKDIKAAVKVTVADAIQFGLIEYQKAERKYVDSETGEEIFTHTIQEEPINALINFMSRDEKAYQRIVSLLNWWDEAA
jgi:hypothetical protein